MSAVIGKLYSPLPSFKTSSPWNNSNAGPQGWPIRWVARWRICLSVWSNGVSIFGHFVAVLWHRRSRWFFLLRNEDFQAIQLTVPLSLCEQCAEKINTKPGSSSVFLLTGEQRLVCFFGCANEGCFCVVRVQASIRHYLSRTAQNSEWNSTLLKRISCYFQTMFF